MAKPIDVLWITADFCKTLNWDFDPDPHYKKETESLLLQVGSLILPKQDRLNACIASINDKFELNKDRIKTFIDHAAHKRIFFNYHEKKEIKDFFDWNNKKAFDVWLDSHTELRNHSTAIRGDFQPITRKETLLRLHSILTESDQKTDILHSLYAAYIFNSFPVEAVHQYFCPLKNKHQAYVADYYHYLHNFVGDKLKRNQALSLLTIDEPLVAEAKDLNVLKNSVCEYIEMTYKRLSNHCYLAIHVDLNDDHKAFKWELYSDIVLFAEKFVHERLRIGYFHPDKIEAETLSHIKELRPKEGEFDIANGGFTYKDCFILTKCDIRATEHTEIKDNYGLLILFEKNERDETIIPCPACRSLNVRGNSYPVIGVKSWECNNLLCPDKSKFNRGKRYSLASLIKQEAIFDVANEIKNGTIRKWQLDVLSDPGREEILKFLIKHYSLVNDKIEVTASNISIKEAYGREIKYRDFHLTSEKPFDKFKNGPFFKRFSIEQSRIESGRIHNISSFKDHEIYQGNSTEVLQIYPAGKIDAAVTSPPYYNAREYSQWDNIYCYLYDMYNNARQVFKSLKPGGVYLYNIFDYFDNENNIVFSAMGKKRMILGAYIIDLFKKAGFGFHSNIVWYKGHIQGNRSFNQGNTFPYYQAPLNCYEHIFCFVKPEQSTSVLNLPDILNAKPFHKMKKGENTLGHTAPFPADIPLLLIRNMSSEQVILDPYAGSFTTARVAMVNHINSVSVEMSPTYTKLGIRLINEVSSDDQFHLFEDKIL